MILEAIVLNGSRAFDRYNFNYYGPESLDFRGPRSGVDNWQCLRARGFSARARLSSASPSLRMVRESFRFWPAVLRPELGTY